MLAAAIFCRARVSRLAVAASVVSMTAAIAAGDSPQSVRSASATRVGGDNVGWQQVKINRSRSSSAA